jgi:hypothetical protein
MFVLCNELPDVFSGQSLHGVPAATQFPLANACGVRLLVSSYAT